MMTLNLTIYLYIITFASNGNLGDLHRFRMPDINICQERVKKMEIKAQNAIIFCSNKFHDRFVKGEWMKKDEEKR